MSWTVYPTQPNSTTVGNLRQYANFYSPQLDNVRDLLVYLPPSYAHTQQHYPVIYMHDGQNLFDQSTSNSGEWQVDETLEALALEGLEAIVVGIPNAGAQRSYEYCPYPNPTLGGGGADLYLRFLIEGIKPVLDSSFRTRRDPAHTGILGASLGGLVSLYGYFQHPEVFGFAGVMSPAFWWTKGRVFPFLEAAAYHGGRLYMDIGGNENPELPERRKAYWEEAHRADQMLRTKGYGPHNYRFVAEPEGIHHERDWACRLPQALRFLLTKETP